jgi:NAD(P)-dependent dehydrogenase (short-subunit alcohol dehydrogenase family)
MKTIAITGTATGLGKAAVLRFAQEGWNVVATVRKPTDLLCFSGVPNVRTLLLDVDDPASIERFGTDAVAQFGQVDALVNNAGYYQMGPLETSTMDQVRAQFETNVFGLIAVTQAVLPHMRRRGAGVIVNLSSISADNPYPFTSVYGASKAAVATLTESLNVELHGLGITVKAVFPGLHATKIFTKIDLASDVPREYRPLMERFFGLQGSAGGSPPSVVADAVFRAVTDGKRDRVRYYAGPDATTIPAAKRLMGAERYFGTVKRSILNGPGPVLKRLARSGGEPVEADLDALQRYV